MIALWRQFGQLLSVQMHASQDIYRRGFHFDSLTHEIVEHTGLGIPGWTRPAARDAATGGVSIGTCSPVVWPRAPPFRQCRPGGR